MDLKSKIRTVPNFPKEGIMFKDITTLLIDPYAFRYAIREFLHYFEGRGITKIVCTESRGFILGAALAYEMHAGFVPLRKPGKLPAAKIRQDFKTEYSTDAFEIHKDAISKGDKVLIVDDLLATGGTVRASVDLVEKLGGEVEGIAVLIELNFLNGRDKVKDYDMLSLIEYEDEE